MNFPIGIFLKMKQHSALSVWIAIEIRQMTLQKGKFNIKIWKVREPSVWNAAKHSINRTISYQRWSCIYILSRGGSWWKLKFNVYSSNLEDEKNPQWLLRRIIRLGLEFGVYYEFGLPRDLRSPKQPRTFTSEIYIVWGLKIWILLYLKLVYKKLDSCTKKAAGLNGREWENEEEMEKKWGNEEEMKRKWR